MKSINWVLGLLWGIVFVFLIWQPEYIITRMDERNHREFFERAAKELNVPVKPRKRELTHEDDLKLQEVLKKVREYRAEKNKTQRYILFGFISSLIGLGMVINRAYGDKKRNNQILAEKNELITRQRNQLVQVVEELERSRNQIRQSEVLLREIMDNANDATLLFALDGTVLDVSAKTIKMFGLAQSDGLDRFSFSDFWNFSERSELPCRYFEQVVQGQMLSFETRVQSPVGDVGFDAEVYMKRIGPAGEEVILVNIHDVSERKQMEDELRHSQQELEVANRSKDKLFSIIAHDLKNPIHTLMAFSEMLVKFGGQYPWEKIERFQRNIFNASRQTYSLLENLLDWSRSQMGKIHCQIERFNLGDVAEEILLLFGEQARKKQIQLENGIDVHHVALADKNMVRTIMRNLVGNAVKYTEEGTIKLSSQIEGEWLLIRVADSGVGMKPDVMKKLYQLSENVSTRGTRNEAGTGLGLMLSREFALKTGGDLTFHSIVGQGSVFELRLKADPTRQEPSSQGISSTKKLSVPTENVVAG